MDRPHRRTNLPPHLDDYEVGYQPAEDHPPKASTPCPSQPRSSSRKTSHSGTSSHSRTSSITSTGIYLPPELFSVQTAVLEEKIKQRQFDSLQQLVQDDSLADMCNGCMPVRAVCKNHSPDLKRGALATDARGCSLWRSLLERPPP